jgi:hypothetical protein
VGMNHLGRVSIGSKKRLGPTSYRVLTARAEELG